MLATGGAKARVEVMKAPADCTAHTPTGSTCACDSGLASSVSEIENQISGFIPPPSVIQGLGIRVRLGSTCALDNGLMLSVECRVLSVEC